MGLNVKKSLQMIAVFAVLSIAGWAIFDGASQADASANGVSFGAFAKPINGQTNITAIEELERQLGTQIPVVRGFNRWDDNIGAEHNFHRWVGNSSRDLVVSVNARRRNGEVVTWRAIANAQPGSRIYGEMQDLARGSRNFGDTFTLVFHHEPEAGTNTVFGDGDDFVAAYRKLVSVFDSEGVNNVRFGWIMTNFSFDLAQNNPGDRRSATKWFPGADVVDFIGSDPYNWENCRGDGNPWSSLEEIIQPLMNFSNRYPNIPLILGEFGSTEVGNNRKAGWINDAQQLFKQEPYKGRFAAILYFHSDGSSHGAPNCQWFLNSSNSSLNAARALAQDSFYQVGLNGQSNQSAPATTAAPRTTTTTAAPRPTTTAPPPTAAPATPAPRPTTTTAAPRPTTTTAAPRPTTTTAAPREQQAAPQTTAAPRQQAPQTTTTAPQEQQQPQEQQPTAAPAEQAPAPGSSEPVKAAGPVAPKNDGVVRCNGRVATIVGTDGPDTLTGTPRADVIHGMGGDDVIYGLQGNDVICGGAGADTIYGGSGSDVLTGNKGPDTVKGQSGPDTIIGGDGADQLNGGQGSDEIRGGDGADTLFGGRHRDILLGGRGGDACNGGVAVDRMVCEAGRG